MRRLLSRRWGAFLGGMLGAMVLIAAILMAFTQTDRGRARILAITLETLGGQLSDSSKLVVERLEGGMFSGARMYGIVLTDPAGRTMVAADSAYIDYQLPTFFGGDVVIDRLVLYHPDVLLYRLPGDSLWNYQAVLQDTTPDVPGQRGRATVINSMRMVDATVTVRIPWEPDDRLSPAEQAAEIEGALSDTSRLAVESVPDGYLRTIVARTPDASIEALTVAPDERGGTYLRVTNAVAEVDLFRDEPLRLQGLQGELSLREGLLRFSTPTVALPSSRLSSSGVIDLRGDEPLFDLQVSGTEVALGDLQWLHPPLPADGDATFQLGLETTPDAMRIKVVDLALAAPGTRLVGGFEMLMGDTLLFSEISLRADPLDVNTVQAMLPVEVPVRGLRIGSVEIRSPAS